MRPHDAETANEKNELKRRTGYSNDNLCTAAGMLTTSTQQLPSRCGELTLQIRQLLLRHILASDHVLNDAVHRVQYHLVVTQWQHRVYLSVQQAVSVNVTTYYHRSYPRTCVLHSRRIKAETTVYTEQLFQLSDDRLAMQITETVTC